MKWKRNREERTYCEREFTQGAHAGFRTRRRKARYGALGSSCWLLCEFALDLLCGVNIWMYSCYSVISHFLFHIYLSVCLPLCLRNGKLQSNDLCTRSLWVAWILRSHFINFGIISARVVARNGNKTRQMKRKRRRRRRKTRKQLREELRGPIESIEADVISLLSHTSRAHVHANSDL